MNLKDKIEAFRELNRKIKNCKKCPLSKKRKNAVPGEGSLRAKIMIVGQAPGKMEDKTGRPFCGMAGKLLDQLLKISKIKREKVFITSVIKCFPPKNRRPRQKEIKTCLFWLKKQIEILNPKKFILLGEVAFFAFFSNKKLKDFRGKLIKKNNKFYFPTYHPAAGLRFPKIKKILKKDFKILKNF